MKSLFFNARNLFHRVEKTESGEDQVETGIEAIIGLIEKSYDVSSCAGAVPVERVETIRFAMTPKGCRDLSEQLAWWADEADKENERLRLAEGE